MVLVVKPAWRDHLYSWIHLALDSDHGGSLWTEWWSCYWIWGLHVSGIVGFSERTAECRQSAWCDGCGDRSCSVLDWALSAGWLCVSIICLFSVGVLLMFCSWPDLIVSCVWQQYFVFNKFDLRALQREIVWTVNYIFLSYIFNPHPNSHFRLLQAVLCYVSLDVFLAVYRYFWSSGMWCSAGWMLH